jgi:hypothetical protein
VLCIHIARSFVTNPYSTVEIIVASNVVQKWCNSALLSNLALCKRPLVHANMDAIELVEVSDP